MKRTAHMMLTAFAAGLVGLVWAGSALAHPEYGCESCHVPHNADADPAVPLWNPDHTTTTLTDHYASPTMDATVGSVDGASKLCLSCHDGTYPHVDAEHTIAALANSHPVSFVYDQQLATDDGELVDPTTLASDILDVNSKMQCTSCHDVHATAAASPNLRWPYENSFANGATAFNNAAFCRNCHLK
ncbi:MAG: hypothetical protein IT445_02040 [Phycisphaeraceae bacterium]|nr:hypothetical protein [Phycisphaeraceae bacterium]